MTQAIAKLAEDKPFVKFPITDFLAATSVGKLAEIGAVLDLNYIEDSAAEVDMNVIRTGAGQFVELQGTGEEATFSRTELNELLDLAEVGIAQLINIQKEALGELVGLVGKVEA